MTQLAATPVPGPPGIAVSPLQDAETLRRLPRRAAMLGAVLLAAAGFTLYLVTASTKGPDQSGTAAKAIPATLDIGGRAWTSTTFELDEGTLKILETPDYINRTYTDSAGDAVNLCLVFSSDNRKGTHPPDVCLEGYGSRIQAKSRRTLTVAGDALPVAEIVAVSGPATTYYLYFYKCGDTFTDSFYAQQARIIWNGLTLRPSGGALVRYSVAMRGNDIEAARARVDALVAATYPLLRDKLKAN